MPGVHGPWSRRDPCGVASWRASLAAWLIHGQLVGHLAGGGAISWRGRAGSPRYGNPRLHSGFRWGVAVSGRTTLVLAPRCYRTNGHEKMSMKMRYTSKQQAPCSKVQKLFSDLGSGRGPERPRTTVKKAAHGVTPEATYRPNAARPTVQYCTVSVSTATVHSVYRRSGVHVTKAVYIHIEEAGRNTRHTADGEDIRCS